MSNTIITYKKIIELTNIADETNILSDSYFMITKQDNQSYKISYPYLVSNISTEISNSFNMSNILSDLNLCQANDIQNVLVGNVGNQINSKLTQLSNNFQSLNNTYINKTINTPQELNSQLITKNKITYRNPTSQTDSIGNNDLITKAQAVDLITNYATPCVIKGYNRFIYHYISIDNNAGYNGDDTDNEYYITNIDSNDNENYPHTCKKNTVKYIKYRTKHDGLLTIQTYQCKLFIYYGCQICTPAPQSAPMVFSSTETKGSSFSIYTLANTEYYITCKEPSVINDPDSGVPYYSCGNVGKFDNTNTKIFICENF